MPETLNAGQQFVLSVNVDVANVSVESVERLLAILPRYGRPLVLRAFADFRREDLADFAVRLFRDGFSLVHCPSWPNGDNRLKSVVDDVLAQDLRDQAEEIAEIDTFVLVTGDRNFIAVANALKRHGKRIIVAAEETSANRELRSCAHEYIELLPAASDRSSLLQRARTIQSSRDNPLSLRDLVKALVPEDRSGTGEERSRVANLLREAADRGLVFIPSGAPVPPQQRRRTTTPTTTTTITRGRRVTVLEGESLAAAQQPEVEIEREPEPRAEIEFEQSQEQDREVNAPAFDGGSSYESFTPRILDFEDLIAVAPVEPTLEHQNGEEPKPAEEPAPKRARPARRRTRTPRSRRTAPATAESEPVAEQVAAE